MTMDKNVNVKTFSLQSTFIYIYKRILNHTDFYLKKKIMTAKAGVWQLPWGCCCHAAYHKQIKTYLFMSLCGN